MDTLDIFFFSFAAIATVIYQMWFFRNSVEKFEDKEKWGELSEEKKKEERKPI